MYSDMLSSCRFIFG